MKIAFKSEDLSLHVEASTYQSYDLEQVMLSINCQILIKIFSLHDF